MTRARRRWGPSADVLLGLAVVGRDAATNVLAPSSTVLAHGEQAGHQTIDGYNSPRIATIARTPQSRQQVPDFYRQQLHSYM